MSTPPSPSLLAPPNRRPPGVRRLNRVPILIACGAGALVVIAVGYTMVKRSEQNQLAVKEEVEKTKTQGSKSPAFLIAGANPVPDRTESAPPVKTESPPPATTQPPADSGSLTVDEQARAQAWQAYYAQLAQQVSAHNTLEQQARGGNMDPLQSSSDSNSQIPGNPELLPPASGEGPAQQTTPYSTGGVNPAGQTGKQAFLRTPGDPYGADEDLKGSVHGPKPLTIMEGTGIPYRLSEGATSDMPGQINAEILQNVYDSMTGDVLLIPQGTRVVGTYDVAVSAGQERMGVIWNRLVFPDTSSRQIGSMAGADQAGLGGMKDLVDTHFWEKFGSALMVSLIGAGAQLSQPQQSAFAAPSSTSAAIGAMTQQMSQFGQAQAQQGLAIPNTIVLRPGLIGVIKVNKDMRLPPYIDHRSTLSSDSAPSMTIGKFIQ